MRGTATAWSRRSSKRLTEIAPNSNDVIGFHDPEADRDQGGNPPEFWDREHVWAKSLGFPSAPQSPLATANRKAAIGPRPELPWLGKPEEPPVLMVPVAEETMLEMRYLAEPEHEIAAAELEQQTAPAEVTEVPRPERPMLAKESAGVELEALLSQVQLRPGVR